MLIIYLALYVFKVRIEFCDICSIMIIQFLSLVLTKVSVIIMISISMMANLDLICNLVIRFIKSFSLHCMACMYVRVHKELGNTWEKSFLIIYICMKGVPFPLHVFLMLSLYFFNILCIKSIKRNWISLIFIDSQCFSMIFIDFHSFA